MPSTRHRFSCGHKGFGEVCARCATADKIEKNLPKNIASEAYAKGYAEVQRLRGPQKKGRGFTSTMAPD
jgi:hypothetical protein